MRREGFLGMKRTEAVRVGLVGVRRFVVGFEEEELGDRWIRCLRFV